MNKSRGERGAQMKRRKFARRLWTVLLLAGLCALLGLAVTGLTVLPAMAGTPKPTKTE